MQYLSGRRVRALVLATSLLLAAPALGQQPSFIGGLTPLEDWVGLVDNPIRLASQVERSTQPFEAPSQPFESPTQPFEAPDSRLGRRAVVPRLAGRRVAIAA